MLYYVELDKEKEFLEIHEAKNIHNLSKDIKVSWGNLDYYLNGTDRPVQWLPCGSTMPFIKNNGKLYRISYYKQIIEKENYRYMSRKVYADLEFMNQFGTVKPTSNRGEVKKIKENDFDTEIIIDCKPSYKSRYSNAIEEDIEDTVRYYREHTDEIEDVIELENTYHTPEEFQTLKICKALYEELKGDK